MALRINESRYRYMISSPAGPVGRDLAKKGVRMESVAKSLITQEKLVRTGRYRSSIEWKLLHDGASLMLRFGSAIPIARLIERGTPPHPIFPRNRRALWWTHGADRGWVVPTHPLPAVNHPGTRAYGILHRSVAVVLGLGLRRSG